MSDYNGWKVELKEAQDRIRELETQLEACKADLDRVYTAHLSTADLVAGTHVIVRRGLLDECEQALGAVFGEKRLDLEQNERWEFARSTLTKLRAQEKADDQDE